MTSRIAIAVISLGALSTVLSAQSVHAQQTGAEKKASQQSAIYEGWRATAVLNRPVRSMKGDKLGVVRNLLLNRSADVEGLLVEGGGTSDLPEFLFRIPWQVGGT